MTVIADSERSQLISRLRKLEPSLRAEGVVWLAIFGSRARNDHRLNSDLDVLIDVAEGKKFSLLDLVGVSHVIGDAIGLAPNVLMRRGLDPQMAKTIAADLVVIF